MRIEWPEALITEIAERRCVLVLGAGASADCLDTEGRAPPTWDGLLAGAADALLGGHPQEHEVSRQYLAEHRLLEAAQVIADYADPSDYAAYLRGTFHHGTFRVGDVYREIVRLDAKVNLTTNFDEILDNYCRSFAEQPYSICQYYDDNAVQELRSPRRLVIKANGSISDVDKLVLTRRQFYQARLRHPRFFDLLNALFMTSTLLFIGHSLRDPHLQLLLENVHIAAPTALPHYALVPGGFPEIERRMTSETYNIRLLDYPAGQHEEVLQALRELAEDVEQYREAHA